MAKSNLIRQINLLAFLLNRRFPVDWQTLKQNIPEYCDRNLKDDSLVRKFARDKETLRGMGIPIETITSVDEFGNRYEGYVLKGESYYLPELKLDTAERKVLNRAIQVILSIKDFPLRSFALSAQQKLIFDIIPEDEQCDHILFQWSEQKKSVSEYLSKLNDALFKMKQITINYYTIGRDSKEKRNVNPYGLMFRQGIWYLIGYDHLRKEERIFRIERIQSLTVNTVNPKIPDFKIPKIFSMKKYMGRESWRLSDSEPIELTVKFNAEISPLSLQWYQKRYKVIKNIDGGCEVTFLTTRMDALIRHVLGFKEHVEIISPKSAREYVKNMLNEIKKMYQ